jgi:pyruvate,orthophosphate dikinase
MTSAGRTVYSFGNGNADGDGSMRNILGGKGANLAEMSRLGLPVPPGFTVTTGVCLEYLRAGSFPSELEGDVASAMKEVESMMEARFGDEANPLLVSVRSGARASMPGMMDTVLNLGLNDRTVEGLIAASGDARFALDCYRRLIEMYGDVVMGVEREKVYHPLLVEAKKSAGVKDDQDLGEKQLREVVSAFKEATAKHAGSPFPQKVEEQLWGAIRAVFGSWTNARARTYRRLNQIPEEWGTAVNVQAMVFGNQGDDCGTGVAFTRSPATGEKGVYGEYLRNAQGEDVVAGIRTPSPISDDGSGGHSLQSDMPSIHAQFTEIAGRLEAHFKEMQDIEFTIMKGRLFVLQTRRGQRTGLAQVRIAVDMEEEGLITKDEALIRVEPDRLQDLLAPAFDKVEKESADREGRIVAKGLNAGPGAASGAIAFSAEAAARMAGSGKERRAVILAREETSPEDIAGMAAAVGILTARGGMTSHAAVVARGMGKPCVVGCGALEFADDAASMRIGDRTVREGDAISIDGSTGEVILGSLRTSPSEVLQVLVSGTLNAEDSVVYREYEKLMTWADEVRRLRVRTNADTPGDAAAARALGAEGIGLCRSEHMFFEPEKIETVRKVILSTDDATSGKALERLLELQRADYEGIFRSMDGLPVTIRLMDPPLHEFLPHEAGAIASLAAAMGLSAESLTHRIEGLREANPMLGHRGCRLGITHPALYECQVKAIFEAACNVASKGVKPVPEVMIPLIGTAAEYRLLAQMVRGVAEEVFASMGATVPYLVGTMIEVPRAALIAGDVAEMAEFFSFGTNDLTQMTWGLSRDDTKSFLPAYVERGIIPDDPFQSLDPVGVGRLVELAVREGRERRPDLKLGICGEHGGDPRSIVFFHKVGLDYVSCSPYRVPIARLAAARESVADRRRA